MTDFARTDLAARYDSAKQGAEHPQGVFRRLEFVSRVMRGAPEKVPSHFGLWWLERSGHVATAAIGLDPVTIGREAGCDVVLDYPKVSRRHCAVRRFQGGLAGLEIEDLGSSNGTWVNGVRLPAGGRRILFDGDVVELGGVPLAVAVPGAGGVDGRKG